MYIIVFVTAASILEAKELSRLIIERKLAACVNIIKNINSTYWWKGKIEYSEENLLIIKTIGENYPKLEKLILEKHSYENPEIICINIEKGSQKYLDWIKESLAR